MVVTELGISMDDNPVSEKAPLPILVTESGMSKAIKLEQPSKTKESITDTVFGISMDSRAEQYLNAYCPILETESGITIEIKLLQQ
jgi:hypothetical protein